MRYSAQHSHGCRIFLSVDYLQSLANWQELTEPSWPCIRVTQAPRFRNSPVWTFQIFKLLSQELVHRKWPLKVKQQLEIALVCALEQMEGCTCWHSAPTKSDDSPAWGEGEGREPWS